MGYLKIILRARVGYEMVDSLAITIAYPTSASGIIVLLKTPKESTSKSATVNAKNDAHYFQISGHWCMSSWARILKRVFTNRNLTSFLSLSDGSPPLPASRGGLRHLLTKVWLQATPAL